MTTGASVGATGDAGPGLRLTPKGHLVLEEESGPGPALEPERVAALRAAFARGSGHGLLRLGGAEVGRALPPALAGWRDFAASYLTTRCLGAATSTDDREAGGEIAAVAPPAPDELERIAGGLPPMPGGEYLGSEVLAALWHELDAAFRLERSEAGVALETFLKALHPAWNVVGRVHFNLAINRKDAEAPFAFLATYTSGLSSLGKAQHRPLGQALREYAGAGNRERLLALLEPVKRAAEGSEWLARIVDAGELFHPLRWAPAEAFRFLGSVPQLERAGIVVRMPADWKGGRPPRPLATATVGALAASGLGTSALLDFRMEVTLGGEALDADELGKILSGVQGLALVRGQWVEVDPERLGRMVERFESAERLARRGGIAFAEAMRMLAGADVRAAGEVPRGEADWSQVVAGPWLASALAALRSPAAAPPVAPGQGLRGSLRPYQELGVRWLHLLTELGLGACLADDMGLGKTIQVLALLLLRRDCSTDAPRPSLLVAPASLLGNWEAELGKFAPGLRAMIAHPSALPAAKLRELGPPSGRDLDLVITSYGSLFRLPWLEQTPWHLAILDEAQAIKNPGARQSRAVKRLEARARIALTGTPIENRIGDLWSIFDFLNPGLLGSAKEFTGYTRALAGREGNPYGALRDLVRPYILRRLKTDRSVISDLPEKTEMAAHCQLSRKQAALYQQAVEELEEQLESTEGMKRRGIVLAFLMRFKQICNHPSQWLGDGGWAEADSGKWARLRELAEVIAARQEKALVFTQFREVIPPLAAFLAEVFGRPGLVLHGETAVRDRRALVDRFQEDESVPFFLLTLKAGGSGLNLTAASHVIHFDRWWNPAVEDQATDRAFRIGQKRNVLVHKFLCRGTVEEKVDQLIASKRKLSKDLLEGGAEVRLTELRDEELLGLVRLDLKSIAEE